VDLSDVQGSLRSLKDAIRAHNPGPSAPARIELARLSLELDALSRRRRLVSSGCLRLASIEEELERGRAVVERSIRQVEAFQQEVATVIIPEAEADRRRIQEGRARLQAMSSNSPSEPGLSIQGAHYVSATAR